MADERTAPVNPDTGYWYTPLAGRSYSSPLQVNGFYEPGVTERKMINTSYISPVHERVEVHLFEFYTREFSFTAELSPGPWYVEWSLHWRDTWHDMTNINWFYIRTPSEN